MNDSPFFSIIIPVRNAEMFLYRSVGSVLIQTIQDFEILVVINDSHDRSLEISQYFSCADKRIHTLETNELGVANARNLGINNARGRFIVFLDADDYLFKDSLEQMYQVLNGELSETPILFTYDEKWIQGPSSHMERGKYVFEQAGKLYRTALVAEKYQDTLDTELKNHMKIRRVLTPPWGKAYSRKFLLLKNLYFSPDCPIFGDAVFNQKVLLNCSEDVPVLCANTYYYNYREGSLSRRNGADYIRDGLKTVDFYIREAQNQTGREKSIICYGAAFYLYCTIYRGLGETQKNSHVKSSENGSSEYNYDLVGSYIKRKEVLECLQEAQRIQCTPGKRWLGEKVVPWILNQSYKQLMEKRMF